MTWRRNVAAAVAVAALAVTIAVVLFLMLPHERRDRLLHPARYAVTGPVGLTAQNYADAAAAALPGLRLAALKLPDGSGPVVVEADRATLWLDPPTARVLGEVTREPDTNAPLPLASPVLTVRAVVLRAREAGAGRADLRELAWPTRRSPDWRATFAGRTPPLFLVADDSGTVARARPQPQSAGMDAGATGTAGIGTAAVLVLLATAIAVLAILLRRRR